jgi:pantetheine-phosphate adenylyltransferase
MQPTEQRCETIRGYYSDEPRVEVQAYNDITVDFCARVGARYIIKGVRSVKDFEYEREQADINRQLSGVETILLYSEPQYASISSTMVRELQHFGVDVSTYLPKPNLEL